MLFGIGANRNIGSPYGLACGQVLELVRVALNGNQGHGHTSQVVMMAVRQLRRDAPLVRLLVSYADEDQGHVGKIYQATNWIYTGEVKSGAIGGVLVHGEKMHMKTASSRYGTKDIEWLREHVDPDAENVMTKGKLKYLYPLDKRMRKQVERLRKPYPKETEHE